MDILPLIFQIVSGAAGGIIICCLFPSLSLGAAWNPLLGAAGGAAGGRAIQQWFANSVDASDMQIFLCCILGGAMGGSLLTVLVGAVKRLVRQKS